MEKHNAKLNRNVIRWLVAVAALGGVQIASAGYAQLANPAGFGGSAGSYTYAASAANDKVFGRVVQSAGSLAANVGGQSVKMGAAYRFAANAPRIAARVVFFNPYVAVGIGVATWIASKYIWNDEKKQWEEAQETPGTLYRANYGGANYLNSWFVSRQAACSGMLSAMKSVNPNGIYGAVRVDGDYCVYQSKYSPAQSSWTDSWVVLISKTSVSVELKPVSETQFVDDLASSPMPETVPLELPYPTPLPIEQPSPWINPTPGENPQNQPYRVPTGQPSPIPNTNPQQYTQPYVDIVPAPLPDNPWRVDIKPGEVTSTDPNPVTNPQPDPNAEDKPTPEEDKSLCEKHPDILACAKPELDIPDGEIPKSTKTITYQAEDTFGGGSCPADVYANINNKSVKVYEWSRTCNVVTTYLRPIILLLGALGALFILIPGRDS